MKQCPQCRTTYTDRTLSYCLADGTALTDLGGEEPTVSRPGGLPDPNATAVLGRGDAGQMRVDIPRENTTVPVAPRPTSAEPAGSSSTFLKVLVAAVVLLFLVLIGIGLAGFIFFKWSGPGPAANNDPPKTAQPAASPLPSSTANDTDELREQIARLEKQLNEQAKTNKPANIPLTLPDQPNRTVSARVNSPGDGFLALRTFPSSETGSRILQIPHGATITVGGCLTGNKVRNKTGQWCRASYNGYSGWVYDAYLIY